MIATKTYSQHSIQSPFGMVMPGRNWQAGSGEDYRFGFNGQELDNDIIGHGDLNTAEFWVYDNRIGKRWNIDPMSRPYYSPYSTFGCNPIYYTDPNGKEIVQGKDKSDEVKSEAEIRINNENMTQSQISMQIEKRLSKGKKVDKLERKLSQSMYRESVYQQTINEILELEKSEVKYAITDGYRKNGEGGRTYYEPSNNTITIKYNELNDPFVSLVHELKHAYQFEKGQVDFDRSGNQLTGLLHDLNDEVEAYQREQVWSPQHAYTNRVITQSFVKTIGYKNTPYGPLDYNSSIALINSMRVISGLPKAYSGDPLTILETTYADLSQSGEIEYVNRHNYIK